MELYYEGGGAGMMMKPVHNRRAGTLCCKISINKNHMVTAMTFFKNNLHLFIYLFACMNAYVCTHIRCTEVREHLAGTDSLLLAYGPLGIH